MMAQKAKRTRKRKFTLDDNSQEAMRDRLEKAVEKMKARKAAQIKARAQTNITVNVAPARNNPDTTPIREIIAKKFGLLNLETTEELQERLAEMDRRELVEMERQRWTATYHRLVPPMFREPWNQDKADASIKREEIDAVLDWKFSPRGIFLAGNSGRSKTRAIFHVVKRLVLVERRYVGVFDGVSFSNACSEAFSDPSQTERWLRKLVRFDVLVIDDLAKRFTPAAQQGAFAVIDRRGAALKPTLVTTNDSGDNLRDKIIDPNLADPLIRRLREYCEPIIF